MNERLSQFAKSSVPTMQPARKIALLTSFLTLLVLAGTVGLMWIEQARPLDALYMSVITLTTVGYGEAVPLSDWGRVFMIVFLLVGIGLFGMTISALGQYALEVRLKPYLMRRAMQNELETLSDHYIISGAGRMGRTIAEQLSLRGCSFVVIDRDESRLDALCAQHGWLGIAGDATDDEVLRQAGIRRAKALATVLPTDADNVYVTLSAHMLNPKLQIIARAGDEKAVSKLQRAGATRVVSPYSSGAVRIARFMVNPTIEDFLELTGKGKDLELADVLITPESPYVGKTLAQCELQEKGVIVLGVRRSSGENLMPPPPHAVFESGDSLFLLGNSGGVNAIVGENNGA